jgi:5'(3')-deoxyribonucleotidase
VSLPVLLLDMDGPLAAFDDYGFRLCTDAGLTFDVPTRADQTHRYYTGHLSDNDAKLARLMIDTSRWFLDLPVTEGAVEGVQQLREHFDIWVCTKPLETNPTCRDDKAAWLREHFPPLERKLIISPDKSLIRGAILLDDAPKLSWIPKATWSPVIFTEPFNGPGSDWEKYLHWHWGDPIDVLLDNTIKRNEVAYMIPVNFP